MTLKFIQTEEQRKRYPVVLRKTDNLVIGLNDSCQFDCSFCFSRNTNGNDFLSFEDFIDIIDTFPKAFFVSFGWGSPELNKDIMKIMDLIKERKLESLYFTNGTSPLLDEIIKNYPRIDWNFTLSLEHAISYDKYLTKKKINKKELFAGQQYIMRIANLIDVVKGVGGKYNISYLLIPPNREDPIQNEQHRREFFFVLTARFFLGDILKHFKNEYSEKEKQERIELFKDAEPSIKKIVLDFTPLKEKGENYYITTDENLLLLIGGYPDDYGLDNRCKYTIENEYRKKDCFLNRHCNPTQLAIRPDGGVYCNTLGMSEKDERYKVGQFIRK